MPLYNALKKWGFSAKLFHLYDVPFTALSIYKLEVIDEVVTAWHEFLAKIKAKRGKR